jgi:hypothetical protein
VTLLGVLTSTAFCYLFVYTSSAEEVREILTYGQFLYTQRKYFNITYLAAEIHRVLWRVRSSDWRCGVLGARRRAGLRSFSDTDAIRVRSLSPDYPGLSPLLSLSLSPPMVSNSLSLTLSLYV